MTDFTGKHGLIIGVANKRSLAWAIAQATARRGARLALTYQGRFEDHVNELSQGLDPAPSTPEAFGAYIKSETGKWAKVVKASGAKAD